MTINEQIKNICKSVAPHIRTIGNLMFVVGDGITVQVKDEAEAEATIEYLKESGKSFERRVVDNKKRSIFACGN